MSKPATMRRRPLDLQDADAVIAEIRRLQAGGYTMLGRWNLAQMCEHFTGTLRVGLEGHERPLPVIVRRLLGATMIPRVIRTRRMMSGVPAPRELIPTSPSGPDDPAMIDTCIATLERARDATSIPPHPMAEMTIDQWKQLNWVHCSHHLSFLIPNESRPAAAPGASAVSGQPA